MAIQVSEQQIEELANQIDRFQELLGEGPAHGWTPGFVAEWRDVHARLETAVWRLSLVPLAPLAKQFETLAWETAGRLKKQVHWECGGFELEVASPVREAISVALLHAVRNSVDHGIETPFERKQAGKVAMGLIRVEAQILGGVVRIRISDDGRGPDLDRIVARAVELNFLQEAQTSRLGTAEKLEILFQPGFSTRTQATATSGRGIGLDAVYSSMTEVGGSAQARIAESGGFDLRLSVPVDFVGADVVPVTLGSRTFWIQSRACERWNAPLSESDLFAANRLAHALTEPVPAQPRYLRVPDPDGRGFWLAVDSIGSPEFRFFRRMDPIWRTTGPLWMQRWMDLSGGRALACRSITRPEEGSVVTGPAAMTLLADPEILAHLVGERSTSQTPRRSAPQSSL